MAARASGAIGVGTSTPLATVANIASGIPVWRAVARAPAARVGDDRCAAAQDDALEPPVPRGPVDGEAAFGGDQLRPAPRHRRRQHRPQFRRQRIGVDERIVAAPQQAREVDQEAQVHAAPLRQVVDRDALAAGSLRPGNDSQRKNASSGSQRCRSRPASRCWIWRWLPPTSIRRSPSGAAHAASATALVIS